MVQAGTRPCLRIEPLTDYRIDIDPGSDNFQRDFALEHGIPGAVDVPNCAYTELIDDFVPANATHGAAPKVYIKAFVDLESTAKKVLAYECVGQEAIVIVP
jgi:hypothetical protein